MILIAPLTEANKAMIEKVYKVYPDDRTLDYWQDRMNVGGAFVFEQRDDKTKELVYAGIVEICEGGLHAVVGGGIDGRIDVMEMYSFLVSATNKLNKNHIRLTGRAGWYRKYLKRLGFRIVKQFASRQGRLVYVCEK